MPSVNQRSSPMWRDIRDRAVLPGQ